MVDIVPAVPGVVRVAATGVAVTGVPAALYSVMVIADGAQAGTVDIRDGAGGPILLTVKAAAGQCYHWHTVTSGIPITTGVHVTLSAGAAAVLEYAAR